MPWGKRVHAAMSVAAALAICCVGVSIDPAWAGDDGAAHVILFSGNDFWLNGAFAYGGLLWSPGGLESPGFTLKALLSGGLYRYNAGDLGGERVQGTQLAGELLPGWRFKRDRFELKVFLGPVIQNNRLDPDDPGDRLRGNALGARFAVDLWNEPTATTMVAADASLSTIATNYSARAAYGWRVLDRFYTGPETQIYGGDGYRQLRFGVHVTSLKIGGNEWSLAGGWALDSNDRSGPYLRIGFMERRRAMR